MSLNRSSIVHTTVLENATLQEQGVIVLDTEDDEPFIRTDKGFVSLLDGEFYPNSFGKERAFRLLIGTLELTPGDY